MPVFGDFAASIFPLYPFQRLESQASKVDMRMVLMSESPPARSAREYQVPVRDCKIGRDKIHDDLACKYDRISSWKDQHRLISAAK